VIVRVEDSDPDFHFVVSASCCRTSRKLQSLAVSQPERLALVWDDNHLLDWIGPLRQRIIAPELLHMLEDLVIVRARARLHMSRNARAVGLGLDRRHERSADQ
jgi:hypothetical protein